MSALRIPSSFIKFITGVGGDLSLTQGLGGNCSIKSGDLLKVKASGKRMTAVTDANFFYSLRLVGNAFVDDIRDQEGKPSIEVFLHALIPDKYVLHLHSLDAIALSMQLDHRPSVMKRLWGSGVSIVPYVRPGVALKDEVEIALATASAAEEKKSFVLSNHGLLVSGNSVQELESRLLGMKKLCRDFLGVYAPNSLTKFSLSRTLKTEDASRILWQAQNNWRITPDHVVFLGPNAPSDFLMRLTSGCRISEIIKHENSVGTDLSVESEQFLSFMNLALMLPRKRLSVLSEEEAFFLAGWESEKLRVKAAASESRD